MSLAPWLRRLRPPTVGRGSGGSSSRWVLLLACVVALGAAFAVAGLHRRTDAQRQNQLVLAEIAQLAKQLRILQAEAGRERVLVAPATVAPPALSAAVAALERLDPGGDASVNVSEAAGSYAATAAEHLRLLRSGQRAAGDRWDAERSEPSYKVLVESIHQADAFLSAQTARTVRRATVGSTVAITLQALVIGLLGFVSERRRRENEVRMAAERANQEAQFRSLIQNSSDVVVILEANGEIRYLSPAVKRVLGFDPDQQQGRRLGFASIHPEDLSMGQRAFAKLLADPTFSEVVELRVGHADGSWRWIELSGVNLLADPNVGGIVLHYREVTERKELQAQLRHQALHDSLTGLANRALFNSLLGRAVAHGARAHEPLAVLYVDLDNFKQINDVLGHAAGDQLLVEVARRLRASLRAEDAVARLGGDEFAVLAGNLRRDSAGDLAARMLGELRRPYRIAGREVAVGASIGIALGGPAEHAPEELLRHADAAMYAAKSAGKGSFVIYESSMDRQVRRQLDEQQELRQALENGALELAYQPLLNLKSGSLEGVEALVHWHDRARRRLLPLSAFLPLAEESGLLLPISRWLLATACRQAKDWQTRFGEAAPRLLSVHLAARQLLDPGLLAGVEHALAASGLAGACLLLELDEAWLLETPQLAEERLRELKRLGVRLGVRDFGSGYSALRKVQRLPVDLVKLQTSFVETLGQSPADLELTHGLIDLARRLRLATLAGGIDLDRQAVALRRMGCKLGQGRRFVAPLAAGDLERLLATHGSGDWREAALGGPSAHLKKTA